MISDKLKNDSDNFHYPLSAIFILFESDFDVPPGVFTGQDTFTPLLKFICISAKQLLYFAGKQNRKKAKKLMKNKLKNILALAAVVVFLSFGVAAQKKTAEEKPDFSGKWILDEKASYFSLDQGKHYDEYVLEIRQDGDEINLKRTFLYQNKPISYETTIYADKRGELNSVPTTSGEEFEFKSKTRRKKNSIVREFIKDPRASRFGTVGLYRTERYSLSADGKTLTVETDNMLTSPLSDAMTRPSRSFSQKHVFRKE